MKISPCPKTPSTPLRPMPTFRIPGGDAFDGLWRRSSTITPRRRPKQTRYQTSRTSSRPHWFLGARTAVLHIDLLHVRMERLRDGYKRWCLLFQRRTGRSGADDASSDGPAHWFGGPPASLRRAAAQGRVQMVEFIQRAGQLMFPWAGIMQS